MKSEFLFGIFPYVALGLLAAGILLRYFLLKGNAVSAEVSQARIVFASGRLWLGSLLLLIAAHLIMAAAPQSLLLWNASRTRLYLLESVAFAAGVAALAGWLALLWRNLKRHGGSLLPELSDMVMLALLFVGITSGLLLAAFYRWGSSWGAMVLTPYLTSLLGGKPEAGLVVQMPFLVRLHVFSLFAAIAITPATRLGSVIVAILQAILAGVSKPLTATGRAAAAWARKHNPSPLFWPEED
jgi:nitrate reductase gamma subunit